MWTAFWIFISAALVALIGPTIAHGIKLAEFRQAWINDLRKDVAKYVGLCRTWVRVYDDYSTLNEPEKITKERDAFSIANDALVVFWRIKMRINPLENQFKQQDDLFLEYLQDLLNPGKVPPGESDMESRWRSLADKAVEQSRELLKREWQVTKTLPVTQLLQRVYQTFRSGRVNTTKLPRNAPFR